MTMSKEKRFKDKPLYCKGSGATCFLGPGSYNDHEAYIAMRKASCPAKIVSDYQQARTFNIDANHPFTQQRKWQIVLHNDRLIDQV